MRGFTRRTTLAAALLAGISAVGFAAMPAAAEEGLFGLDASVIEAAKAEGQMTLYSAQAQDLAEATASAFEAAVPGIEVNVIRAASGPLSNRFATEYQAGVHEADAMNSANIGIFTGNPDWWTPLSAELVPGLAKWPKEQVTGLYFNSTQSPQLIAYNPNLVPEGVQLKTWEDVLRPEFKGKAMMIDPRASNNYLNWLNLMYDTYGAGFVQKLRDQGFTLVEGGTQGTQQVAAGAFWFVFPPSYAHAQPLVEGGAPLKVVYPSENSDITAIGPMASWGLPAKAPHPNAGRVFLAWLSTEAGQQVACGGNSASVILPDYDGCQKPPARFKSADDPIPDDRKAELLGLLGLQ